MTDEINARMNDLLRGREPSKSEPSPSPNEAMNDLLRRAARPEPRPAAATPPGRDPEVRAWLDENARAKAQERAEAEAKGAEARHHGLGGGARGAQPLPPSVDSTLRALVDERRGRIAENAAAYEQDRRWRSMNTRPEDGGTND